MTPAAITPAGRATSKKRGLVHRVATAASGRPPTTAPGRPAATRSSRATSAPSSPAGTTAVPGHRRRLRPQPAPKTPRRVSGPTRGRLTGTASPRPRTDTRRQPSRGTSLSLGARALAFVRALPDHPLLDRLIRGRAWIPVLGLMLAGIVAMQVEVLKLGTSIGRSIERGTALQSRNDQLRMTVAALNGDQNIERLAAARGMIMPAPATVGFLSSHAGGVVHRAMTNIHAPNASGFLSQTTTNGAVATVASSQAASSGSSTYASAQPAGSTGSGTVPASSGTSPAPQSAAATAQSGSPAVTPSQSTTSAAATAAGSATGPTSAATTAASTTSSGQSTTSSGQSTPSSGQSTAGSGQSTGAGTSTAPVGTVPSQSSTSASGGAGIPVGG